MCSYKIVFNNFFKLLQILLNFIQNNKMYFYVFVKFICGSVEDKYCSVEVHEQLN